MFTQKSNEDPGRNPPILLLLNVLYNAAGKIEAHYKQA